VAERKVNVTKGRQGFQETEKTEPGHASLGSQDLGEESTEPQVADPAVYVDPYPGKKGTDKVTVTCGKCRGTGIYNAPTRIKDRQGKPFCLDCSGAGSHTILVSSARSTARRQVKALVAERERVAAFSARNEAAADKLLRAAIPGFKEAWENPGEEWTEAGDRHAAAWEAVISVRAGGDLDSAADRFDQQVRRRWLPKLVGANKWNKPCDTCGKKVKAGDGVLAVHDTRENGEVWKTFCAEHVPADAVDARR
jgi:hypothetical protein